MDTSEKPVNVANKDAQPVAIQKPTALPLETIMTKAPQVNPVTAQAKVESDQQKRHCASTEVYEWYSQEAGTQMQGR